MPSIENLIFMAQFFIIFWLASRFLKDEKCARGVLFTFSTAAVLMSLGALLGAPGFSAAVMERTTARLTVAERYEPELHSLYHWTKRGDTSGFSAE